MMPHVENSAMKNFENLAREDKEKAEKQLDLAGFNQYLKRSGRNIFPLAHRWGFEPSLVGYHYRNFLGLVSMPNASLELGGNSFEKYLFVFYQDYGNREQCGYYHDFNQRSEDLLLFKATGNFPYNIANEISSRHGLEVFSRRDFLKESEKVKCTKGGSAEIFYSLELQFSKDCCFGTQNYKTVINGRDFRDKDKYQEMSRLLKPIRNMPNDPEWSD